ncbi:PTS N-acetylgalactosamine transporter subunit IID, partial [Vibrio alfacsensis]
MESNVSKELNLKVTDPAVQPAPGVSDDEYENKEIGTELTKADINKMAWRSLLLQA